MESEDRAIIRDAIAKRFMAFIEQHIGSEALGDLAAAEADEAMLDVVRALHARGYEIAQNDKG